MFVGTAICIGILSFVFSGTYHINLMLGHQILVQYVFKVGYVFILNDLVSFKFEQGR